jgi:hypothetical protein
MPYLEIGFARTKSCGPLCLEIVKSYENESGTGRSLLKCEECGQLYFCDSDETVHWSSDGDELRQTYIPVESVKQANMILALTKSSDFSPTLFHPRLVDDWPAGKEKSEIGWIRGETPVIG